MIRSATLRSVCEPPALSASSCSARVCARTHVHHSVSVCVCVCVGAHTRAEHTRAASSAVSRIQRAAPSSSCPTATAARDVRVPQARTHGLD